MDAPSHSSPQREKLQAVLDGLRQRATGYDISGDWPAEDLSALAEIGAMRWAIPRRFEGDALSPLELHLIYEAIASASLATALIFSQRDSAVGLLEGALDQSPDNAAAMELLPRLARGEIFSTIGIAQLTTSRQGGAPALRCAARGDAYQLDGIIPWSTGAGKSHAVIAGAVLDSGQQILFALPTDLPGVIVQPPMPLVSLRASWTTAIECHGVILPSRYLLRGPTEKALGGRKKSLPIGQAFLATGLCLGGLWLIGRHTSERAQSACRQLTRQLDELRAELLHLSDGHADAAAVSEAAPRLRGQCNDLALRITQAAVALYKGTALLNTHPAQRLAREAMFLLVWSCPNPVIDCTLDLLTAN